MSSATKWRVSDVSREISSGNLTKPIEASPVDGPTNHMSPRQIELDRLWRFYRCTNYAGRKYDWNGHPTVGTVEHDVIARTGYIPPGFTDAGGALLPLKFRQPSTPYFLGKVIVNRFTSLLFGKTRQPKIMCDDPATEEWLIGFAEATRLWSQMIRARTYGGAMGSVGVGFKFVRGQPFVEVHDPRWSTPTFSDRDLLIVSKFEKLYQYVDQVRNSDGECEDKWFWYRRYIDEQVDIVWPRVEVESNEHPIWERERNSRVQHGFGFCPVVWIQNMHVDDDVDGDPDCHGIFELIERIDALLSQADRATIANTDPTLTIASDLDFDQVKKGTGNAIMLEKGGSANYLEMTGQGIEKAIELAEKLEEKALSVARCMLDRNEGGPSRTAQEVEHNYSSMIEQADIFREQYGERGVKPLLAMVMRAVRMMSTPRIDASTGMPRIVRTQILLPKKLVIDETTGNPLGWVERDIGQGEQMNFVWPKYFTPTSGEVSAAVDAAGKAYQYGLMDRAHAISHIVEFFNVENKAELLAKIESDQQAQMGGGEEEGGSGGGEEGAAEEGGGE